MFGVAEMVVIGIFGYILPRLEFHSAQILLGFVLGPRFEESFRRAMALSHGDIRVFIERPISATLLGLCLLLILVQVCLRARGVSRRRKEAVVQDGPRGEVAAP